MGVKDHQILNATSEDLLESSFLDYVVITLYIPKQWNSHRGIELTMMIRSGEFHSGKVF